MRRITSLCLLLALTTPALAAQDCDIDGIRVNPDNGSTTQGKTGLMRCRDRDSGQPLRDQELRNGDYVGLVRYYDKGVVQREYHVNQRGNRQGQAREFHPDGRLALEGTYRDGKAIGITRSWHKNGAVKRVVARSDDGRQEAKIEFNDNGQLKELKCVEQPLLGKDSDDGRYCGHGSRTPRMHELFSDKGMLRGRITLLDGRTVKHETLWDNGAPKEQFEVVQDYWVERSFSQNSVLRKETRWVAADQGRLKHQEQEFHESGPLVRELRWEAGELATEITFFLNGQPKSEQRYRKRDGRAICDVTEFHDNGRPRTQGAFLVARGGRPDRPLGMHRNLDAEGRLRGEREYDANGRLVRERELDENGRVLRDDAVFEDGSRKAFTVPR